LPDHLKAQVCRELDRLELLLEQIKAVEAGRDVLRAAQQVAAPAPAAMLLDIKGIGPEFAAIIWSEGPYRLKKTTIVALARKLLVALWKYVTAGVVIEGAVMKRT
jgi:transposase